MNATPPQAANVNKLHKWHRVVLSICFVVFVGELGLCLIAMPWLSNWEMSYIPMHVPQLSDVWMSPYFRGVLSGLGILNVWVALAELTKIFRLWFGKGNGR